ncbi:hypothetical protein GOODEAATRI_004224, partial [Goodea atripinnis]
EEMIPVIKTATCGGTLTSGEARATILTEGTASMNLLLELLHVWSPGPDKPALKPQPAAHSEPINLVLLTSLRADRGGGGDVGRLHERKQA